MNKKYFVLMICVVFIFAFIGLYFVHAEEGDSIFIGENATSIGNLIAPGLVNYDVTASNVNFSKEGDFSKVDFNVIGGVLEVNGSVFENIAPSQTSEIILNKNGEIESANFLVDENGGTYTIAGTRVVAPGNSRVKYNKDGSIEIISVPGSKVSKLPVLEKGSKTDVIFRGKDVSIPGDQSMTGTLRYDGENYYMNEGDVATINNVKINCEDEMGVYFDSAEHDGNYVSFGEFDLVYETSGSNNIGNLNFQNGNPYFRDMEDSEYVEVSLISKNSKINLESLNKEIPSLRCNGGFDIKTGGIGFNSKDEDRLYYYDVLDKGDSSVKMNIFMDSGFGNKLIFVGENSDFVGKVGDSKKNIINYRGILEENKNTRVVLFADNQIYDRVKDYEAYLKEAQDLLNSALERKYSIDLSEYSNVENNDLDNLADQFNNVFLTSQERANILRGTDYENYINVFGNYRKTMITLSTYGDREGEQIDFSNEAYGIRHALYNYGQ